MAKVKYNTGIDVPGSRFSTQNKFQQAAVYAQVAAKTMPIYKALAQNTAYDPYLLALSDWIHPPVIHKVTRLPGCIRVDASDNVLVTNVFITILDEQGLILEQGEAALIDDACWEYPTAMDGTILVEAFDFAGNCTRQEVRE